MIDRLGLLWAILPLATCSQPSAPSPIAAPLRELPWGQLNFLHTTDVHGWWGGHLQEPSYSADWGDYISFAKHLRDRADADGSDLLLVDTGDRIEGNGIFDASEPKGKYTYDISKHQHIDLICSGNHELYKKNSSEGEFYHTVPNYNGNYLATNLDIYNPETDELEPLAPRYKKFTTKNQGIRILAFGFIFDFTGNENNTVIHPVQETVREPWFREAISDEELDLIVVFGHVDVRSQEYATIFAAIRAAQGEIPIQFFGGHSHIRDYKIYDRKSVALESGRYMETIGFMSITGLTTRKAEVSVAASRRSRVSFSRLYVDNNLFSLHHHSNKDDETFRTELGFNVSTQIHAARKALGLDEVHGCAPRDLWVSRAPYPSGDSLFTWLEKDVLPDQVGQSPRSKAGAKTLVITNTGAMRFDIFRGPFTKDTTYLVSPFTSGLKYIPDVPFKVASRVIRLLNNEGPIVDTLRQKNAVLTPPEEMAMRIRGDVRRNQVFGNAPHAGAGSQSPLQDRVTLIPGYTTQDDAGSSGDDTFHLPIAYYEVPNCIQAVVGFEDDETPDEVDLVFNEFIQPWILMALQYLGEGYTDADCRPYLEGKTFTTIITDWVSENWGMEGKRCPL